MNKFTLLAAVAATTVSMPAFAQGAGETDNGGVFVGATAGYDTVQLEAAGVDSDDQGIVYGITAGYDYDAGKAIIGVEAEVTDSTISDDIGDTGVDIYGGLRLGYEMDENDIIYLKAGYTNVDVDFGDNLEGIRVGAGFEHNFGGFIARSEYRYSTYNVSDVLNADVNGNRHQVVLTLGAKF